MGSAISALKSRERGIFSSYTFLKLNPVLLAFNIRKNKGL